MMQTTVTINERVGGCATQVNERGKRLRRQGMRDIGVRLDNIAEAKWQEDKVMIAKAARF